MLPWPWLVSPPTALYKTLCTSGFVDDVILSSNGENRPESKTMHIFRPVHWVHDGTGLKSACCLLSHLVCS